MSKQQRATLAQKIKVLDYFHQSDSPQLKTVDHFKDHFSISTSSLSEWLKNETELRRRYNEAADFNALQNSRRKATFKYEKINKAMDKLVQDKLARNELISEPILRKHWAVFAQQYGVDDPKRMHSFSHGWLSQFKKRHGIKKKKFLKQQQQQQGKVQEQKQEQQKQLIREGLGGGNYSTGTKEFSTTGLTIVNANARDGYMSQTGPSLLNNKPKQIAMNETTNTDNSVTNNSVGDRNFSTVLTNSQQQQQQQQQPLNILVPNHEKSLKPFNVTSILPLPNPFMLVTSNKSHFAPSKYDQEHKNEQQLLHIQYGSVSHKPLHTGSQLGQRDNQTIQSFSKKNDFKDTSGGNSNIEQLVATKQTPALAANYSTGERQQRQQQPQQQNQQLQKILQDEGVNGIMQTKPSLLQEKKQPSQQIRDGMSLITSKSCTQLALSTLKQLQQKSQHLPQKSPPQLSLNFSTGGDEDEGKLIFVTVEQFLNDNQIQYPNTFKIFQQLKESYYREKKLVTTQEAEKQRADTSGALRL